MYIAGTELKSCLQRWVHAVVGRWLLWQLRKLSQHLLLLC